MTKKVKKGGTIPRPKNAFMLYCDAKREKVRQENPNASITDISKILGEKWRAISDERRTKYQNNAKQLKAEYDAKIAKLGQLKPVVKKTKSVASKSVEEPEPEEDQDDEEMDDEDEADGVDDGQENVEKESADGGDDGQENVEKESKLEDDS